MAENDTHWSVTSTTPDTMDYTVDNVLVLRLVGTTTATANDSYHFVSSTSPTIEDWYAGGDLIVRQVGS